MRWQRLAAYAGLLAAWSAFAAWQYFGYRHERELIRETLHQQSHSVMNALVGGIRSHRRLGHFFDVQLQGMLEELAKSQDVLSVAVTSDDGRLVLSAGKVELLDLSSPVEPGDCWNEAGLRLTTTFRLAPADPMGPGGGPGGGLGAGLGGGRGPGRRREAQQQSSPFSDGGHFASILVLDRTRADLLCRHAAWSHVFVSAAGALVLVLVALAWRASVRLVAARGRAHTLEAETRHLRELSQAASGLAHETRNPLGLIRGWTQCLVKSDVDASFREEHAQTIMEECDRVTARINQFLAFARPHEPSLEPVDVDDLTAELGTILQPDLEARNLTLQRQVPESAKTVRADRELLRQALFNLLQNAVQFSPEGETVRVGLVAGRNGCCRIEVADRGPGVAEENVESLFAPYFTTRPDGTGLGLAIVKRLATLHGWEASYAPRSGGGSVFALDGIHV